MMVLLAKSLGSLRPVDDAGEALVASLGHGEIVAATVKKPRNVKFHRWFWALATVVSNNVEPSRTPEQIVTALKIATGHVETIIDATGKVYYVPRSISFASMSGEEFNVFVDRCIKIIVERWLPGVGEDALRNEVLEMIGGGY
jgi:hypothetical protein